MSINNRICIYLKTVSIFCFIVFLQGCSVKETDISSQEEESVVPVDFSVTMDSDMFESSSEVVPMRTKSDISDTYNVIKFAGYSTLVILKKVSAGWIVERKMEDLYSNLILKNTDGNELTIPPCELRPGTYRFVLFVNSKNKLNSISEKQVIVDPAKMAVIKYGFTGTTSLLGEELFIAKTGDWNIKRNDVLNNQEKRTVDLKLTRVVAMIRMVMTTVSPDKLTKPIPIGYNLTSQNSVFCSGVNLFGEMIKDNSLKLLFGLTNVYNNTSFEVEGRDFYFGRLDNSVANRPRYFLIDEPEDSKSAQEYTIEIVSCDEAELSAPIICNVTLKRNTINGIVILKDGNNYSCFEKNGEPYPVNFPSLPYSDYIELNNN